MIIETNKACSEHISMKIQHGNNVNRFLFCCFQNYSVVDQIWIIKDKHGAEAWVSDVTPKQDTSTTNNKAEKTAQTRSMISDNIVHILKNYTNNIKIKNNPY